MAISNGLSGSLHGKLGKLVSYKLNGKNIIRHIGENHKPASLAQLAVRQKVSVVNNFLRAVLAFIKVGYELEVAGTDKNAHNAATSYHIINAIQGVYPTIGIDYNKALLSKGTLDPAINPKAALTETELTISWQVNADLDWSLKNDRSMLLIYCPDLNKSIHILSGARRASGNEAITLPINYLDKELHIYIAFSSNDRKQISNSTYVHL